MSRSEIPERDDGDSLWLFVFGCFLLAWGIGAAILEVCLFPFRVAGWMGAAVRWCMR